jgi:hypothetical protein
MSIANFSGSAISSTYQRLVQTDGTFFADGTGSLLSIIAASSSVAISASYAGYAVTASYLDTYLPPFPFTGSAEITGSLNVIGPFTASSSLITGNVVVLGTASINTLIVNQTKYSSGSNQLGDAADDTQTLYGTVKIPTGSLSVNGQTSITGSLIVSGGIAQVWDLFLSQTPGGGNNYTLYWDPDNARVSVGPLPTLQSVTNAGNSTSDPIIVGGLTSSAANITTLYTEDIKPSSNIISVGNAGTDYLFLGVKNLNNLYPFSQYYPFPGIGIYSRDSAASATRGSVIISYNSGSSVSGNFQVWSVDNDGNKTERLVVSNAGNVGIGTNTPAFKLDVQGTGRFTDNLTVTGSGLFSGSVGIGTSSPSYKLDVVGTTRTSGTVFNPNTTNWVNSALRVDGAFGGGISIVDNISGFGMWAQDGGTTFILGQGSTGGGLSSHFTLKSTGNVGIGTTSPGYQLTLTGRGTDSVFGVDNGNSFVAKNTSGNYETYLWPRWTDNYMYLNYANNGFFIRNNNSVTTMFMTGDNKVGIGTTTPAYALEVVGDSFIQQQIRSTNSAAGLKFVPSSGNNYELQATTTSEFLLYDRTVNAYRLWVNGSGNIGIGTTSPTARLEIKGAGTTSATNALNIQNASSTRVVTIDDTGRIFTGGVDSGSAADRLVMQSNFWSSLLLDAGLPGETGFKAGIVSRRDFGQPFYIELGSGGDRVLDSFEGGAGLQVPSVLTQGVRRWQSLETNGSYHHIHSPFGSWPSGIKLTNPSTNTGSTDGVYMGLWTSGIDARLWNYETTGRWDIGVGNVIQASINTSSFAISSSLVGEVLTLPISSGTASMDCSQGNFFTLTLSGSYTLHLSASNIQPGQTINLRITQPATSGSLSYGSAFKFAGGIPYSASATGSAVDIISFISFDSSTLYGSAIKNLS